MKRGWVILALVLAGCGREKFRLSDGTVVRCAYWGETSCGMELHRCENDGHYYCQTNVERLED